MKKGKVQIFLINEDLEASYILFNEFDNSFYKKIDVKDLKEEKKEKKMMSTKDFVSSQSKTIRTNTHKESKKSPKRVSDEGVLDDLDKHFK